MSKHYISCARCDKDIEITHYLDCYSSDIDGKLLCHNCWQKEQPKYLANKIYDLEAKLADMERCAENNKKVAILASAEHNAKIQKLEQQLAEKDKEIEKWKTYYENCSKLEN